MLFTSIQTGNGKFYNTSLFFLPSGTRTSIIINIDSTWMTTVMNIEVLLFSNLYYWCPIIIAI